MKRRSGLVLTTKVASAALSAAVSAGLALRTAGLWKPAPIVVWFLVVTLSLLAFGNSAFLAWKEHHDQRLAAHKEAVKFFLLRGSRAATFPHQHAPAQVRHVRPARLSSGDP